MENTCVMRDVGHGEHRLDTEEDKTARMVVAVSPRDGRASGYPPLRRYERFNPQRGCSLLICGLTVAATAACSSRAAAHSP